MKNNVELETISNRVEQLKKKIPNLVSEVTSEQIIYNEELKKIIDELKIYEEYINKEIEIEIKKILKKDISINSLNKEIENIKEIIINSKEEQYYLTSSGLDEILYKISYSKDVDLINKNINIFIIKMEEYGITLYENDFEYTYYTSEYMKKFFESRNMDDFYINMKKFFDEIYWVCPNIIKQLVLNIVNICEKNKKTIYRKIVSKCNSLKIKIDSKENNYNLLYSKMKSKYEELLLNDTFNIYEFFENNKLLLKKMMSFKREEIIRNNLIKPYNNSQEESIFITNSFNYMCNLKEYSNVIRYQYIIDYVNNILSNNQNNKLININKYNRKKDSFNKKIIKYKMLKEKYSSNGKKKEKIDKLIRINNGYLTSIIDEIYTNMITNNNILLNNDIKDSLTIDSSIYDAFNIIRNHYLALSNIIYSTKKELDVIKELSELNDMIYSANTSIMKNTAIGNITSISTLIEKKYMLCNINSQIDYTNIESIEEKIEQLLYIILSYNLKNKKLDLEDIKICMENEK